MVEQTKQLLILHSLLILQCKSYATQVSEKQLGESSNMIFKHDWKYMNRLKQLFRIFKCIKVFFFVVVVIVLVLDYL